MIAGQMKMVLFKSCTIQLACLLILTFAVRIQAHGYLKSPRSRNFVAYKDGVDWGGGDSDYAKDYCPHCANRGGTDGQCGNTGQQWYDVPKSMNGGVMPADPQAVFSQGQVIDLDVVLTAHHKGHFEFAVCPITHGQAPTGDCFDSYPLEFVSDPLYGAVKDVNYPTRAYIAPSGYPGITTDNSGVSGQFFRFRMKLPDNLTGDLVLLQWHYYTANTCQYVGYESYPFPSDWGFIGNVGVCESISPNGSSAPEQFWNCAEIRITSSPTSPTASAPVPGPSLPTPTFNPYPSTPLQPTTTPVQPTTTPVQPTTTPVQPTTTPVQPTTTPVQPTTTPVQPTTTPVQPTTTPVQPTPTPVQPTPAPVQSTPAPFDSRNYGTCGGGAVGNGICVDPTLCCSEWGWCGNTPDHCKNSPTAAPVEVAPPPPSNPVTPIDFPPYANGQCESIPDVMTVNVGYYQSWAIWRNQNCQKMFPWNIDVEGNLYSHLIYSFASISANHEIEPWGGSTEEEALYTSFTALKEVRPGLKTLIAVGGWTFNDPGATQTRFSETSSTAENRAKFAASCVQFCRMFGFDGVDLDWEYPGDDNRGGATPDKTNLGLLVQAIRDAFDAAPEDLELTMAIPIADWRLSEGYDLPVLSQSLDFFNLMSYDIYGVWSEVIGANADMQFIFNSVQNLISAGVPRSKMVLGLAAYGRTFNLESGSCTSPGCPFSSGGLGGCAGEEGYMPYFTVNEYVQSGNYKSLNFNPSTGTMEMVTNSNVWISFDNPATFNIKAELAYASCFRGVMWWAVDMVKDPIILSFGINPSPPLLTPPPSPAPIFQSPPLVTPAPTPAPIHQSPPLVTPAPTPAPIHQSPPLVTPAPTPAPATPAPSHAPSKQPSPGRTLPTTPSPVGSNFEDWIVSTHPRCGASELDARGNCRATCVSGADCPWGQYCWGVHSNFCGSKPAPAHECFVQSTVYHRCGRSELHARETCGPPCTHAGQCTVSGESCYGVNSNFCGCDSQRRRQLRGVEIPESD